MTAGVEPLRHRRELRASLPEVSSAVHWIETLVAEAAMPRQLSYAVQLCAEEALTNVVRHAYGDNECCQIVLTIELQPRRAIMTVEDGGAPFDPVAAAVTSAPHSLDSAEIGGMGIPLMRRFAHHIAYERRNARNLLHFTFEY